MEDIEFETHGYGLLTLVKKTPINRRAPKNKFFFEGFRQTS